MKIGFIGAGRVGCTMGKYLVKHGADVTGYWSRTPEHAKEAAEFTDTTPIGRSGKTRLAKQLASCDEVRGGIYIGMEDFSDRERALRSKILYLLKIKSPELGGAIDREVLSEGAFHALYITGTYIDSRIVSSEDVALLRDSLLDTGRFSTIVFDIGGAAIDGPEVLSAFDRIYMPTIDVPRESDLLKRLKEGLVSRI